MKTKLIRVIGYKNVSVPEPEDVLNFLKGLDDDHAGKAFIKNLQVLRETPVTLEEFISSMEECPLGIISGAFVWDTSKEGGYYWTLIDVLWRKYWKEISGEED